MELREIVARNLACQLDPEPIDMIWPEYLGMGDEVLAAIQETHHVVPKDRERWEKLEGSGEGLVMCPVCESWTI
jgi:hypothetical protein